MTRRASHARPSFQVAANRLASRQHGIVTRRQLLGAGVPRGVIERRVSSGWLQRVHRGVYRFGPVIAPDSDLMAACLAYGPGAVVSHGSGAVLHRIRPLTARPRIPEISVPFDARRRQGIRVHRVARLDSSEITRVEGVPVTTAVRTLCDLAPRLTQRELERAISEAIALRLTSVEKMRVAALARRGWPGSPKLIEAVFGREPDRIRSKLEAWFLALIRAAGLPLPEANQRVLGHEVDFLWRRERVIVEADGYLFHEGREAFEEDRARDAALAVAGFQVIRVTWRRLEEEPGSVLDQVVRLLRRGGGKVRAT
jgi:very-short-patch-repair endonuclease